MMIFDIYRLDLSDNERLTTLIRMSAMELSHSLSDAGHRYAMTSACSGLTPVCRLNETYGGMSHVWNELLLHIHDTIFMLE